MRFYFSFRSPYSWLAYRDLVDRHPAVADRLEWIPFWEPDQDSERALQAAGGEFVYTPMSRAKHLYVLQDVRRLAAARGLTVTWPVDREPWWEVPHLAYIVAARHGRGRHFAAEVYRARWQEGRDICDRKTVADLAAGLGIDPDGLAGAVDDPDVRAEGVRALLAIHRDGVFGVPFFVNKYDKFWGVDRLDAFIASLRDQAGPQQPSVAVAADLVRVQHDRHTTDGGHAGGCG